MAQDGQRGSEKVTRHPGFKGLQPTTPDATRDSPQVASFPISLTLTSWPLTLAPLTSWLLTPTSLGLGFLIYEIAIR